MADELEKIKGKSATFDNWLHKCEVGEVQSKESIKDHPGVKMKSNYIRVRNRGVEEGSNG